METAEMIVARIDGGLGNQMFQYAFGLQLARKHQTELVLDLQPFDDQPVHGYLLDRFRVNARPLAECERLNLPRRYQSNGVPFWHSWLNSAALKRVKERPFGFSNRYLRSPDHSYLVGYWQSEQFFPDVRDDLRQEFQLRQAFSPSAHAIRDRLLEKPSMAVHVRRGDYLTNKQNASIYRHLSIDYYRRAVLARLTERTGVEVTVFSNDISWCQQHLALPCPTHFVGDVGGPAQELMLMSSAEAIAIANSTFSWWAAWLSERSDPRIFAPRKWFHQGTLSDRYLPCPGWTLMDDRPAHSAAA